MRILGIDPGYAIVGYGLVEYNNVNFKTLAYGAIQTHSKEPFNKRLVQIYDEYMFLLDKYKPTAVAVEKLFFITNKTTAIDVAQARGLILLGAEQKGIETFEYTPLQVKQSVVGYGRAEKKQVMEMTKQILNLQKMPKLDDTADALAVAICHGHSGNSINLSKLLN